MDQMERLTKKQIRQLFNYSLEDPKNWVYNEDRDELNYSFSGNRFNYDSINLQFLQEGSNWKHIKFRYPLTLVPVLPIILKVKTGSWINEGLIISLFGFLGLATSVLIFALLCFGLFPLINIIFGSTLEVNNPGDTFIAYGITYFLYSAGFFIWNRRIIKKLKILDRMMDKNQKIVYEKEVEENNIYFEELVQDHFKKQERKEKLKKLIKVQK